MSNALGGRERDAERGGRFGHRQAGEEAELHQFGFGGFAVRELRQGLVEGEQIERWRLGRRSRRHRDRRAAGRRRV